MTGPQRGSDKRAVRQAARRLEALGRLGGVGRSDEERLRDSIQSARNEDVYEAAARCPDCLETRQRSGDATALCDRHLTQAMGG